MEDLPGAAQSKGRGEETYEWSLGGEAPELVEFELQFKDGSIVKESKTIGDDYFNRFGISEVFLVNLNGHYLIEPRYGIVHEYDGRHSGYINGWCFDADGVLETLSHEHHVPDGQINLYFTNRMGKLIFTVVSHYVGPSQPRTILNYNETGELREVEVCYEDNPEGIEMHYAANGTLQHVTRDKNVYHPGGVLLKDVIKEDITNQPELFSKLKFPDLGFMKVVTFSTEQELSRRRLTIGKQKHP